MWHIKNHLNPHFGNIHINRINFDSVEKYMVKLRKEGKSEPLIRKILITLNQVMKYATRKRYIETNPVREVDKPKNKTGAGGKIDFLTPYEIRALLDKTNGDKQRMIFLMAVMSGMRQGELLGLKWGDIDWINNQVCVRRTYNHGRFYEPKSEKSYRRIDLSPLVVSELKRWRLQCMPNELDLVFPNEAGKPMFGENLVKRSFKPALRRAGIREIRFHDLRHTYATLLVDQGEHPKYIQEQMGHSSINITMDVYGHLMKAVNTEATKKLEKAVFGENGDILETSREKEEEKALNSAAKCLI